MRRLGFGGALGAVARLSAGLGVLGACASPGVPPGGPERLTPPRLVRTSPDTNAVGVRPRAVVFTFDAVLSETPRGGGTASAGSGATGLEAVTLVSPRSGSVSVDWDRERVAIRPRRGFRPNVTYTVTFGPGVQDLRNNVRDTASVLVFSTGGPIARGQVRGAVFDWVNGRPAPRAVVEITGADSATYVALADSGGRFVVPNVPPGPYRLRGTVDLNGNRAADPREAFDTVPAVATVPGARPPAARIDTTVGVAVYAFPRDTLAPRLTTVTSTDSVTLRLTFDRPLLPGQAFAGRVRVAGADSAALAIRSVLSAADADSVARAESERAERAGRDSAAQSDSTRRDSTRRDEPDAPPPGLGQEPARANGVQGAPVDPARQARQRGGRAVPDSLPPLTLGRPVPPTDLVLRLAAPLRPNTNYRVTVRDLRSLNGVVGTSDRAFTTPRPAPPAAPPAPAPAPAPAPSSAPTPRPSAPPGRPSDFPPRG